MNYTEFENTPKNDVRVCIGDDNDLIRRGDALNAIREMCRIGCLPSSALTRKEQRKVVLFDALQAVRTVKKAAVSTVDPESLRPTAHWENEDDYYGDSIVWCCSACRDRFILEDGTPEENNYEYCPHCGARMVNAYESI